MDEEKTAFILQQAQQMKEFEQGVMQSHQANERLLKRQLEQNRQLKEELEE